MTRFLLTKELGRLAKWLRILGFDTSYFTDNNPGTLMIKALRDNRTILTRNRRLPESRGIKIIELKSETLKEQLQEILKSLNMTLDVRHLFTRCIICNEQLMPVDKEKAKERVPEYVYKTQDDFMSCPHCNRTYWQGTHWGNVQNILKEIGSSWSF
ncbi:MAG: Mut7-C RNAse domain-containing protein [Candidatus Omnitrophota bacterium]